MRLELVPYNNHQCLQTALQEKEVHATCAPILVSDESEQNYQTEIRVKRIYQIVESELSAPNTVINYVDVEASEEKH
jgi:putative multicomponent Na+:H+ antiporter subunit B